MTHGVRMALIFCILWLAVGCGGRLRTVTIRAAEMRFGGGEIHVRAGETVNLRLINQDGYAHAFDQDEYGIHVPLAAKQVLDMTFTPDRPGRYTFYCSTPGHTDAGMVGTLVVDP